jgi:hypothetical protein
MLYRLAGVIAILVMTSARARAGTANPAPETLPQKRAHVLHLLKQKNYFKNSSCTEVANDVLKKIGLPPLWRPGLIKGQRGAVSRPPKPQEPPLFTDEITPPGKNPIKVQIQSKLIKPQPPQKWRLHLSRSGQVELKKGAASVSLDTDFDFNIPQSGHCELADIDFKLVNSPADRKARAEQVKINECIDLFFISPKNPPQEYKWIEQDCAMALRYSPEARKLAQ